jgi:hypothetical protein
VENKVQAREPVGFFPLSVAFTLGTRHSRISGTLFYIPPRQTTGCTLLVTICTGGGTCE